MNYEKLTVEIESMNVLGMVNGRPVITIRRIKNIQPWPPPSVWQFIRYVATQIVPIRHGGRLITFCHEMRDEIVRYFKSIGFDIEPLFHMSVVIMLSSDEYEFLAGLV